MLAIVAWCRRWFWDLEDEGIEELNDNYHNTKSDNHRLVDDAMWYPEI